MPLQIPLFALQININTFKYHLAITWPRIKPVLAILRALHFVDVSPLNTCPNKLINYSLDKAFLQRFVQKFCLICKFLFLKKQLTSGRFASAHWTKVGLGNIPDLTVATAFHGQNG